MARIISLGSALQDIFLIDRDDFVAASMAGRSIFQKLEIGTKVDIDEMAYFTGGAGTNSATAFARYGHEAFFIGNVAHDAAGEAILATLDEERINNSYVGFAENQHTGCSVVLLDAVSGERTILTHRGASEHFDNFSPNLLTQIQPDWMYVSTMGGDLATLEKFLRAKQNCKVMWNPGVRELRDAARVRELLPLVDILIVNQTEAASLVAGDTLGALLTKLLKYVEIAIITDSAAGAVACSHAEGYRLGLYENVPVRDTTGAGDAFGSGFLAHYAAHQDFKSALIFAAANSTSVIQHFGAKEGLLTPNVNLHGMPIEGFNPSIE